jgi:hypothetical protein
MLLEFNFPFFSRFILRRIHHQIHRFQAQAHIMLTSASSQRTQGSSVSALKATFNQVTTFSTNFLLIVFTDFTKGNPGPGQYEQMQATSINNERTMISKYRNCGAPKISQAGQRFDLSYIKRS